MLAKPKHHRRKILKRLPGEPTSIWWRHDPRLKELLCDERFRVRFKGQLDTSTRRSFLLYGRKFLRTFPFFEKKMESGRKERHYQLGLGNGVHESPIGIWLSEGGSYLGVAYLGFKRGSIIVEALQGLNRVSEKGRSSVLHSCVDLKMPWPYFVLDHLVTHARACKIPYALIRLPETLHNFKTPHVNGETPDIISKEQERIRAAMKKFYARVAETNGYTSDGKEFYVKKL